MPNRNKYELLRDSNPQFERTLRRRIERGDTYADLAFWIRTRYKVRVSHESVRQWRAKYLSDAA